MKKLILSALVATALVGCGGSKKNDDKPTPPPTKPVQELYFATYHAEVKKETTKPVPNEVMLYKSNFYNSVAFVTEQKFLQLKFDGKSTVNAQEYAVDADNDETPITFTKTHKIAVNKANDKLSLHLPDNRAAGTVEMVKQETMWKDGTFAGIMLDVVGKDSNTTFVVKGNKTISANGTPLNLKALGDNIYQATSKQEGILTTFLFTMFDLNGERNLFVAGYAGDENYNLFSTYLPQKK